VFLTNKETTGSVVCHAHTPTREKEISPSSLGLMRAAEDTMNKVPNPPQQREIRFVQWLSLLHLAFFFKKICSLEALCLNCVLLTPLP